MSRAKLSFTPTIAKPCEQSWAEMQGSSRERHCELCDKQVHNFAAMMAREIEKLTRELGGNLCARLEYRTDGSPITLDEARKPVAARWVAAASLAMSAAGLAAQTTNTAQTQQAAAAPDQPSVAGRAQVGEVVVVEGQSAPEGQPVAPVSRALVDEPTADAGTAVLSGTVIGSDGAGREGASISLRSNGAIVAHAVTNKCGAFEVKAPVGTYDFESAAGAERIHLGGMLLKEGEQSLGKVTPMNSTVVVTSEPLVLMGTTEAHLGRMGFWYIFRHPVRYFKNKKATQK